MSILLDLVRGLAALVVLMGHIIDMDMYTGPFPFHKLMAHNAVVVFFVLSGLVIAHSVHSRPTQLRDFVIARMARILPVSLFAVAFSLALFTYALVNGLDLGMAPPYDSANIKTVLLPIVFLSESAIGDGLVWNPPYWSLAYEVWFYVLFAVAVYLKGRQRVLWLMLTAMIAGWKILLMLPIWLMGVAIIRWSDRLCLTLRQAPLVIIPGVALCYFSDLYAVPVVLAAGEFLGVSHNIFGFSKMVLTDTPMGLGISLIFIGLRPVAQRIAPLLEIAAPPIRWLAGCSFTLYVLHNPILLLVRGHGIGMGDSVFGFVVLMAVVVALCAAIAPLIEHRGPQVRLMLKSRFGPRVAAA
ncbi:acyltransferase [Alteraurantiacibacter aestuarii]|uniref:acyltransferase family protein n=1 Tax=Alteraurantiacibacter aestuarii TaxID=650004 RepID=UPI0031E2EA0D